MPAVSGWRDVLVMAAIGHHAVFTHRNNILAGYIEKQARLIPFCARSDRLDRIVRCGTASRDAQHRGGNRLWQCCRRIG
jgi:hypothetical protein